MGSFLQTSNSFTQEEEVLADTLLALSQNPHVCEATAAEMRTGEDISSVNIASTSCSEGSYAPCLTCAASY
jgi:hypothetical protein